MFFMKEVVTKEQGDDDDDGRTIFLGPNLGKADAANIFLI